jgi:hypothetical protein
MDYAPMARHSDDSLPAAEPLLAGKQPFESACADKTIIHLHFNLFYYEKEEVFNEFGTEL